MYWKTSGRAWEDLDQKISRIQIFYNLLSLFADSHSFLDCLAILPAIKMRRSTL